MQRANVERRADLAPHVLERLADAVIVADASGHVVLTNAAATHLFGRSRDELLRCDIPDLMPERLRSTHAAAFRRLVGDGVSVGLLDGPPVRTVVLHRDGVETDVDLALASIGKPGDADFMVIATFRNVAEVVALEAQLAFGATLRASVEASRDGVIAVSPDGKVLAANRRFSEVWRIPAERVVVGADSPAVLAECREQVVDLDEFDARVTWGREHPHEVQNLNVPLRDGRTITGYAAAIVDHAGTYLGRVWYVRDDTERLAAAAQLAENERAQRFLLDASGVLAAATGYDETVQRLAEVAVPTLGDLCLIDVRNTEGRLVRMAAVHADPAKQPLADRLLQHYAPDPTGNHPSIGVIADGTTRWASHMTEEFLRETSVDEEHFRIISALGFTSYMTVPLNAHHAVLGSLTLVSAGSGRRFGPKDVALAEALASRVALVVAKARRHDAEQRISHALQTSLLPQIPQIDGLEVAVRYVPGTRDAEVGGDFYDVVLLPNSEVALAVGDVAGHDIIAASNMSHLRSALRAIRLRASGPADTIDQVQESWELLGISRIATVVCARLDLTTGALRMSTAGHPPPLVVERDNVWFPLVDPAPPLGAPPVAAAEWEGVVPAGAALLFFTDGLVEDHQRDITEGLARLARAARAAATTEPEALADYLLGELTNDDRADDVALLVVRFGGPKA